MRPWGLVVQVALVISPLGFVGSGIGEGPDHATSDNSFWAPLHDCRKCSEPAYAEDM